MRILAIYRHYWPDTTPYARLLRAILERWVSDGHTATVYTAQPSYNDVRQPQRPRRENVGGVEVYRIGLLPERKRWQVVRGINFFCFLLRAVLHVLRHREYDLIVANTHPPVLMGATLRLIKRLTGIPYLLHCQDIHPESAMLAGQLKDGWLARVLLGMDVNNCLAAKRLVTLSSDMQALLRARPGRIADNVEVINNFPLDLYYEASELPAPFRQSSGHPFRVFFAGNMGHFQDLGRLVEAARLLRDESQIHFILMGAGSQRDVLLRQAAELVGRTVFFEPYQPVETAFACMRRADVGVICLAEGVYRVAYPSKTMTYLAAGLPLLAIVEPYSHVAAEVRQHQFGYVPAGTTPPEIADAILAAYRERHKWDQSARAALCQRAEREFGRDRAMKAWSQLAERLERELRPVQEAKVTSVEKEAA